jgi:hypothetical protein
VIGPMTRAVLILAAVAIGVVIAVVLFMVTAP